MSRSPEIPGAAPRDVECSPLHAPPRPGLLRHGSALYRTRPAPPRQLTSRSYDSQQSMAVALCLPDTLII